MDREALVRLVQEEVLRRLDRGGGGIPVAVSNRHIHLSQAEAATLFGDAPLTKLRDLSQPGEFAANETVTLVGPKGVLERVRVLGPLRQRTQVEVSWTDALHLGVTPPVRDSGKLDGSAPIAVVGPAGTVMLKEGVILALRHIHMTPEDALRFGVTDKQFVSVRKGGDRSLTLGSVIVRVSPNYRLELHLDTDEANAGLFLNGDEVELLRADSTPPGTSMKEVVDHRFAERIGQVPAAPATQAPDPREHHFESRVLTASDVSRLAQQQVIRIILPPRGLVTALANDLAREKGLQIERR